MNGESVTGTEQKRRVRRGYDVVSEAYRGDDYAYDGSGYEKVLNLVLPELRCGQRVLELGCGCGIPVTKTLTEVCDVTGVDISRVQLARARKLVPGVSLVEADMCRLAFRAAAFRGVVAFYSLIHVPLDDQRALLGRLWEWLEPRGFLLASVGYQKWTGSEEDWCGVPGAMMFWSHEDRATYRRWFEEAGFVIEREEFMPEGTGGATVLLARKPEHRETC